MTLKEFLLASLERDLSITGRIKWEADEYEKEWGVMVNPASRTFILQDGKKSWTYSIDKPGVIVDANILRLTCKRAMPPRKPDLYIVTD